MSMFHASIPVFEIGLNVLSALVDKAQAYAEANSVDPTALSMLASSTWPVSARACEEVGKLEATPGKFGPH